MKKSRRRKCIRQRNASEIHVGAVLPRALGEAHYRFASFKRVNRETMSEPPIQRYPKRAVWLCVGLVGFVSASLAATAVFQKWNAILWMFVHILGGAGFGVTITWSLGCRGYAESAVGGALGCATVFGVWLFVLPWLTPPDPNSIDKFGGGISSGIAGLACGLIYGAMYGSAVGCVAELCRRISIRK